MAVYAIGDVQGCFDELTTLLDKVEFDPAVDQLWFTGDLVNRGPKSLETLRFVKELGDRAITVLGNHDLHLLAVHEGHGKYLANDTLDDILNAPDRDELMGWLRRRPLLHWDADLGYAMVHAGLAPQWDLALARQCAEELHQALCGDDYRAFIADMYGNEPKCWSDDLVGIDRLRVITNVFTRLRYCRPDGKMNFKDKLAPGSQRSGTLPWFEIEGRRSADIRIIFGHWSTLPVGNHHNALALDGGCLWGGTLVAARIDTPEPELFSLPCAGACQPKK